MKEFVKNEIARVVGKYLEEYFDFVSYQTDVDDYYFRLDGVLKYEDEFEAEYNDQYLVIKAWWGDATLNDDLDFYLYDVDVEVIASDENDNETKYEFHYDKI